MNIEIIKASENTTLDYSFESIKDFGLILNNINSFIKMSHWFIKNYNIHEILGDLYSDLDGLFDKLQEEIIGTYNDQKNLFPKFNYSLFSIDNIEYYKDDKEILKNFYMLLNDLKNILTSLEFNDYLTKVKSGLQNTKEEIISRINKTFYLLSMIDSI